MSFTCEPKESDNEDSESSFVLITENHKFEVAQLQIYDFL